jgi:hypothetical protein
MGCRPGLACRRIPSPYTEKPIILNPTQCSKRNFCPKFSKVDFFVKTDLKIWAIFSNKKRVIQNLDKMTAPKIRSAFTEHTIQNNKYLTPTWGGQF